MTRRRPRMKRRVIYLDAAAEAALAAQMNAHGIKNASALIRARLSGYRPGAEPGSQAAAADAWWDTRPPTRRLSVHLNHTGGRSDDPTDDPDQLTMFEEEAHP